jgi:hypothetical protein
MFFLVLCLLLHGTMLFVLFNVAQLLLHPIALSPSPAPPLCRASPFPLSARLLPRRLCASFFPANAISVAMQRHQALAFITTVRAPFERAWSLGRLGLSLSNTQHTTHTQHTHNTHNTHTTNRDWGKHKHYTTRRGLFACQAMAGRDSQGR